MTAIADLPGPRPDPAPRQRAQAAAGPPARDDRAVGPALRARLQRSRSDAVRWSRSPSRTRSTRSCVSVPTATGAGARSRRSSASRASAACSRRGRRLAPPAPARGHGAQHEPPAPLLRRHPHRHRAPAVAARARRRHATRDPGRLHGLHRRRHVGAGVRAGPQHARARRRRAAARHRGVFAMLSRRIIAPFPYWRVVKPPADRAGERSLAASGRDRRLHRRRAGPDGGRARAARGARELPREHAAAQRGPYSDDDVVEQRLHDAARGRGHDGEHAVVGDVPAGARPGRAGAARGRGATRCSATIARRRRPRRPTACTSARPSCARRCG